MEHTAAERRILAGADHAYIVNLRYAFQTSKKLYMIMDYYAGGSLFVHLRRHRRFSVDQARFYAAEFCLALAYLHSQGIVCGFGINSYLLGLHAAVNAVRAQRR